MDNIVERIVYGIVGAFLGVLIAGSALFFYMDFEDFVLPAVAIAAAAGFLLGALGGRSAIDLLKDVWWWT